MTFDCILVIGKESWAAPRLKDAVLSESKMRECYFEASNPNSLYFLLLECFIIDQCIVVAPLLGLVAKSLSTGVVELNGRSIFPPVDQPYWKPPYMQIVLTMRKMYQVCKLVHGDLSEYNILYHEVLLFYVPGTDRICPLFQILYMLKGFP